MLKIFDRKRPGWSFKEMLDGISESNSSKILPEFVEESGQTPHCWHSTEMLLLPELVGILRSRTPQSSTDTNSDSFHGRLVLPEMLQEMIRFMVPVQDHGPWWLFWLTTDFLIANPDEHPWFLSKWIKMIDPINRNGTNSYGKRQICWEIICFDVRY